MVGGEGVSNGPVGVVPAVVPLVAAGHLPAAPQRPVDARPEHTVAALLPAPGPQRRVAAPRRVRLEAPAVAPRLVSQRPRAGCGGETPMWRVGGRAAFASRNSGPTEPGPREPKERGSFMRHSRSCSVMGKSLPRARHGLRGEGLELAMRLEL